MSNTMMMMRASTPPLMYMRTSLQLTGFNGRGDSQCEGRSNAKPAGLQAPRNRVPMRPSRWKEEACPLVV
jgi:hypothetical protein